MKNLFYLLFMPIFISACSGPKEPEFVAVKNVKVLEKSGDQILIGAAIIMRNPNIVGGTLINTDLEVWVNNVNIAKVKQDLNTTVKASSNFTIPLKTKVKLSQLLKKKGLLKGILGVLSGKDLKVQYIGNVKIKVAKIPFTIPVDFETEIPLDPE